VFHPAARIIERRVEVPRGKGVILVAAAGTSDIPVAEEAGHLGGRSWATTWTG
jgi:NCAIR mutase (PurE)-related protein